MEVAGRLRKKNKEPELVVPIKNVTICDAKTGFVVLECIYQWPEQAVTTNLGSLILSFYQFAREVDDGENVSVNFEKYSKHRSRPTGTLNRNNPPLDTMKMVCRKNSLFVVSVYYDMRGQSVITQPQDAENLSRLLQMIEIEFQMKYGGIYLEQQPIIATLDSSNESAAREIRDHFTSFRTTIHSLTQSCFQREGEEELTGP